MHAGGQIKPPVMPAPIPIPISVPELKRFACMWPGCSRVYHRSSSLRKHYTLHVGERPFLCPNPGCGRSFTVNSNMLRHSTICVGAPPAEASRPQPIPAKRPVRDLVTQYVFGGDSKEVHERLRKYQGAPSKIPPVALAAEPVTSIHAPVSIPTVYPRDLGVQSEYHVQSKSDSGQWTSARINKPSQTISAELTTVREALKNRGELAHSNDNNNDLDVDCRTPVPTARASANRPLGTAWTNGNVNMASNQILPSFGSFEGVVNVAITSGNYDFNQAQSVAIAPWSYDFNQAQPTRDWKPKLQAVLGSGKLFKSGSPALENVSMPSLTLPVLASQMPSKVSAIHNQVVGGPVGFHQGGASIPPLLFWKGSKSAPSVDSRKSFGRPKTASKKSKKAPAYRNEGEDIGTDFNSASDSASSYAGSPVRKSKNVKKPRAVRRKAKKSNHSKTNSAFTRSNGKVDLDLSAQTRVVNVVPTPTPAMYSSGIEALLQAAQFGCLL